MDRPASATPTAVAVRRICCAVSAAASASVLTGCSVGPPEGAGSSATVSSAPAPAVITIPGASRQLLPPDSPLRVEASGGHLTDVSVSRESDNANIAGSAVESTKDGTTAWATTEPLGADETFTVAAVAENPVGETTEEQLTVSTAPIGGSAPQSTAESDPDL